MKLQLNNELSDALDASGDESLEVVDPRNNHTYFVVDGETHLRAMEALRRQQDHEAIAEGIAQMKADKGIPLEEARKLTRDRLLAREP